MKVKVITYAKRGKKVARKYVDLTPVNDVIFTSLYSAHENNPNHDNLMVYIKIKHIYTSLTIFPRGMIHHPEIFGFIMDYIQNYTDKIKEIIFLGKCLPALDIEVCRELGIDIKPMIAYQKAYEEKRRKVNAIESEFRKAQTKILKSLKL